MRMLINFEKNIFLGVVCFNAQIGFLKILRSKHSHLPVNCVVSLQTTTITQNPRLVTSVGKISCFLIKKKNVNPKNLNKLQRDDPLHRYGGFGTLATTTTSMYGNKAIREMSNEKELNRRKEVDDLISKYARKKAPPMPPPPTTGHSQHSSSL